MVFTLSGCASPKPIEGGPADTTPPTIIESESTPNQQVNFDQDVITITFDEWITLKDVYTQLVISPLMPDDPEITQKGKSVIIELPDSLREETTYTINFGNAITDLNEGNILENFVFVFSTGDELDSIRINGTVIDAVTLKPADDLWVMLYKTGEDSAVYKRKPDYIARTNKDGKWSISFLPADSFNVVALKDENVNFLYDQEGELFGWLDEPIFTGDQTTEIPAILIFPVEKRTVVREVIHVVPGWMKIVVDAPLPKPMPSLLPPIDTSFSMWDGDTLHVWYNPQRNYSGYVVLQDDSTLVRASSQASVATRSVALKPVSGRLKPGGKAVFTLQTPIANIDTNLILVQHDTFGRIPVTIERDSINARQFSLSAPWQPETRYPVMFLPGAITDYWGRVNDTIRQSVVVSSDEQFGDLFITVDGLDSTKQYLIYLMEGARIVDTFITVNSVVAVHVKRGLLPYGYTIEVVQDENRNGIWDTGSYARRRQPEKKMIFIPDKLRAGWEQEVKLSWK